ncbi:MAG: hypothetical protein AAB645_00605 [Patescibacteria group bacterium]
MPFAIAYAETIPFVANINQQIVNPILEIIFVLGFIIFLWGVVEFIWYADSDQGKETGKSHMIWGVVGMFVMVSVFGLLHLIENTITSLL